MTNFENLLTSTTLIPLWAKALESVSEDPILVDKNAYPLLKSLGYDLDYYDKKKQNLSQVGCCLRAKWIDDETLKFINEHEASQVIQLGAGIDDRFRRINMPEKVRYWYDLDLEEVAAMRKKVIPEVDRNKIISMNMFDTAWMQHLKENDLPTLVIIEGVLMYIEEEKINSLIEDISTYLGNCTVLFDSVPPMLVGRAKYHDSVTKYNKKVEYIWGAKWPEDIEKLSDKVKVLNFVFMSDLPMAYKFNRVMKFLYRISPYLHRHATQRLVSIRIEA